METGEQVIMEPVFTDSGIKQASDSDDQLDIQTLMELAQNMKSKGQTYRTYKTLFKAGILCFRSRSRDFDTVGRILTGILEFWTNFEAIVYPRRLANEAFPGVKIPNAENENATFLEYFIRLSREARLVFNGNRLEFCLWSVYGLEPDQVEILTMFLRYGVSVSANGPAGAKVPTVKKYLWFLVRRMWTASMSGNDFQGEEFLKFRNMFQLVLRSLLYVDVNWFRDLTLMNLTFREDDAILIRGREFLENLVRAGVLHWPGYKTCPSLKHICRINIRWCLHRNWVLPEGVYELNMLPKYLQRYLDLLED